MVVRDVKEKSGDEEKKKEKPKAHAPSHTKMRSIGKMNLMLFVLSAFKFVHAHPCVLCFAGLDMEPTHPAPAKKSPVAPPLGDKYNIKPPVLKRPRYCCSLHLCELSTILWCSHATTP